MNGTPWKEQHQQKQQHPHFHTWTKTEMWYYLPSELLMHICLKMMKSLPRTCVCVRPTVQSGSLDAHMHGPLSSNSPLLPAIIPFHTLSIPKTVVHQNQQQTLAFLPIISPPLFFITQRPPHTPTLPLSEQTQARSNMNYKCMANKREKGERKEAREQVERDRDGEKWLVETSEKMTPLQESIDQFLSKGDVRHEITWQFEH